MLTKKELKRSGFLREDELKGEKIGYIVGLVGGENSPTNKLRKLSFFTDYIKTNGSDKYGYSIPDRYVYAPGEDDKFKKLESILIDNLEYFLNHNYIILWVLDDSIKRCKNNLSDFAIEYFLETRSLWVSSTVDADPVYLYPIWYIEDNIKNDLNNLLYHAAMTNKTYADTIRRIFKFYGKECVWNFVHSLKVSGDIESMSATVMANMIDIFDTTFRPDEESDEVKSLLVDTFTRGAELINDFIKTKDENHLNTELKKLMQDTYKRYASLEDSADQQHDSSPEPESEKTVDSDEIVVDAPQIEYDNEFNSIPEYDDLKAYEAYIKQQQRDIVDQYIKRKEEKAKMENIIDTVATVDSNGKVMYVAKENINSLQLHMLNKVFRNKNIKNILKQKMNNTAFHLILIYADTINNYKVFCFNNKNELLFHYIGNEKVIHFSEEKL